MTDMVVENDFPIFIREGFLTGKSPHKLNTQRRQFFYGLSRGLLVIFMFLLGIGPQIHIFSYRKYTPFEGN